MTIWIHYPHFMWFFFCRRSLTLMSHTAACLLIHGSLQWGRRYWWDSCEFFFFLTPFKFTCLTEIKLFFKVYFLHFMSCFVSYLAKPEASKPRLTPMQVWDQGHIVALQSLNVTLTIVIVLSRLWCCWRHRCKHTCTHSCYLTPATTAWSHTWDVDQHIELHSGFAAAYITMVVR